MVLVRAPDRADSTTELLPHDFFRTRWYTNEGNCLYSSAILQCIKVNFSVVFVHFYEWTSNTEQKDSDVQYKCCVILNIVFLGGFTFKDCIPVFHFWAGCRVVWYVVWEWDAVCLGGNFLGDFTFKYCIPVLNFCCYLMGWRGWVVWEWDAVLSRREMKDVLMLCP